MLVPFSPPPGINSDDTTFAAEGRWADGNNVRFRLEKPQVIGGWASLATLGSGNTVSMHALKNSSGTWFVVCGAHGTGAGQAPLNIFGGGAGSILPASGVPTTVPCWNFGNWGFELLVVPQAGTLYHWTGSGAVTEVTQAPNRITAMLVTPRRQCIAYGCNEEVSGTFNPRCIRGADLEDYTDWTTSAANNVFEHILDDEGEIVTARQIGDHEAVWTTTSLFLGEFVGDPGQTYRFTKIDGGTGAAGPRAVCVFNGMAYWMAPDGQLRRWAPGMLPESISSTVRKGFMDNWSEADRVHTIVHPVGKFNEIWIRYASTSALNGSTHSYIAVSLTDGSWFKGSMSISAVLTGGAATAYLTSLGATYNTGAYITASGTAVYVQEHGKQAAGSVITWHIQSADRYLDNSRRRVLVRGFIPDFEDQTGSVKLTLYVRDRPQSSATTKGPHTLSTADTKKDFRASGKIIAAKLSNSTGDTDNYMRLGKPLFDVVPMGER